MMIAIKVIKGWPLQSASTRHLGPRPHAARRPCTEPPSIMSGPGLLSFNLLRVWVSRVQGPGQPRPHDEMRCAAALHSDTALWETRYIDTYTTQYLYINTYSGQLSRVVRQLLFEPLATLGMSMQNRTLNCWHINHRKLIFKRTMFWHDYFKYSL